MGVDEDVPLEPSSKNGFLRLAVATAQDIDPPIASFSIGLVLPKESEGLFVEVEFPEERTLKALLFDSVSER